MQRSQRAIKPVEDRRFLGIGMVIIAVLMFTGIDTSAKWLALAGIPPFEIVFLRYVVHLVIVLAIFLPTQGPGLFRSNNYKLEIIRAMVLLTSTVLNFTAVKFLPLTVTGSIIFSMPLILTALSGPLLGEHVGWRRWVAILVGFLGVLIIIRPGGQEFHWAVFLSIACTISYAFYNILTRKLAGVDSPYTQQIYSALVATLCITPFAFTEWVWPSSVASWTAFFAMGVFAAVGHLLVTVAHRLAQASVLAPFVYPQIIFMTAASWLVFGQAPDIWIFIGAPIVIGSGLFIWLREKQLADSS